MLIAVPLALGHGARPEYKGCDCAAAVGGRDSLFLWPGGGMGAEGAGGGELHLPLLPRLLIAAAHTGLSR